MSEYAPACFYIDINVFDYELCFVLMKRVTGIIDIFKDSVFGKKIHYLASAQVLFEFILLDAVCQKIALTCHIIISFLKSSRSLYSL